MINKFISGIVEHLSTEIKDTSKIDLILKPLISSIYSKSYIYINAIISLYFLLLFICLLNLIILLFKN
jgi:hypothetical protein